MPTYDYVCEACGHEFEHFQSMSDRVLRTCPKCGKKRLVRRIGAGAGLIFKGSGFYATDYKSPPRSGGEGPEGDKGKGTEGKGTEGKGTEERGAERRGAEGKRTEGKSESGKAEAKSDSSKQGSSAPSKKDASGSKSGGGRKRPASEE